MVVYPVTQMLYDLSQDWIAIPNVWDRDFITSLFGKKAADYTPAQYNKLLDLYNKYILVQACPSQIKRDYNYAR